MVAKKEFEFRVYLTFSCARFEKLSRIIASPEVSPLNKQNYLTITEFESSSIFSGFGLYSVGAPSGYRVYMDARRNYLAALRLTTMGGVEEIRMIPVSDKCETQYIDRIISGLIDFFYGGNSSVPRQSLSNRYAYKGYRVTYSGNDNGPPEIVCSSSDAEQWNLIAEVLTCGASIEAQPQNS